MTHLKAVVVFFTLVLAVVVGIAPGTASGAEDGPARTDKPLIQIAILLDTSGSMDGLIEQAKSHLWKIVNEFATTKRDGVTPELQVALYEYGNDGLQSENGYIRQITSLTTDLDKVSEELFKLRTNGGSEFCGYVIQTATLQLPWSASAKDYKAIFIAGNEPFTQGSVDYASSCKAAIAKGVIVNTIHCGNYDEGVNGKWLDGAQLADGSYAVIDQNQRLVHIPAPQDSELAELNSKLNTTYVAYGAEADVAMRRQAEQDQAAQSLSPTVAGQRAAAKSSAAYRNTRWDLVDASKEKDFDLKQVKEEELPKELQGKTDDEKKAYIDTKAAERAQIQARIQELSKARDEFVTAERRKMAEAGGEASLDEAILGAVRKQLTEKQYIVEQR